MPTGTLTTWNEARGFGYIRPDDAGGSGTFVHAKDLRRAGVHDPRIGDAYEFALGEFNGRPVATALYRLHRAGGPH